MKLSDIIVRPPAPDFYIVVADKVDAVLALKAPDIDLSRPGGWRQARNFLKAYNPRLEHLASELDATGYARMVAVLVERQRIRRRSRLRASWEAVRPWAIAFGLLALFAVGSNFDVVLSSLFGWPIEGGR